MISDRQLKRAIADLKSLERKCFGSRQRFAFYEYLAAVLEFYRRLRRKNEARKTARRITQLCGLRKRRLMPATGVMSRMKLKLSLSYSAGLVAFAVFESRSV